MSGLLVKRYDSALVHDWNRFVHSSKNGTFLFDRAYMDYHSGRFVDHSLVITADHGQLLAVLPAHITGADLFSHSGLTYGGLIVGSDMKVPLLLSVFDTVAIFLREQGVARWMYKSIPYIYHRCPAEEDRYALFLCGAIRTRCDVLAVVGHGERPAFQQRRIRSVQKAIKAGCTVIEDTDWAGFWEILTQNLQRVHGANPVHSLQEIDLLRSKFPDNIRLFTGRRAGRLLGGVVIYQSAQVAHVQYIGSCPEARDIGALDLVFQYLLAEVYKEKPYFDFGISNEQEGRKLNRGLIEQKEGFGARTVTHEHFSIDLTFWESSRLLEAML